MRGGKRSKRTAYKKLKILPTPLKNAIQNTYNKNLNQNIVQMSRLTIATFLLAQAILPWTIPPKNTTV